MEAQALFATRLARLVASAGGDVVGGSSVLDLDQIVAAAPDVVLLDLDFTEYPVADALDVLREEAPSARTIVLTAESAPGRLACYREVGAAAVLSKAASEEELIHDLTVVFDGGAVWDQRVESF